MKDCLRKTLEITGYLVLAMVIPSVAVLILHQFPQLMSGMTTKDIGQMIVLGLLFSALPGLIPFYLFRKWHVRQRWLVPATALLLEALWFTLLPLDKGDNFACIVITLLFPPVGIAIVTILTATLARLRRDNPPVKLYQLAIAVFAELFLGGFLPTVLIFISILRNI